MTTIGSLFSGYGGLDLAAAEVFGARPVWHCEFDAAPARILAHHWPDIPNHHDVTTVDWAHVERPDILTGGFPCQDVSVAGRRAGMLDGTRSGLWSHMAHAIDVLRPGLVIIENVGGLFSAEATRVMEPHPLCLGADGSGVESVPVRALPAVLSTLSELGYDAQWVALRAADVGAPHGRLRVFITAHPEGEPWSVEHRDGGATRAVEASGPLLPTPAAARAGRQRSASAGATIRPTLDSIHQLLPTPRTTDTNGAGCHGEGGPDLRTVAALLPTPSVADVQGGRKHRSGDRSDELLLNGLAAHGAFGPYALAIERWERVLGRPAPAPTEPGRTRPRLSAAFVEWLMGLPAGHVTAAPGLTRNQQLKALGNGVVPRQAATALRHLHHLTTGAHHAAA